MANEISLTLSLSAYKYGVTSLAVGRGLPDLKAPWGGTAFVEGTMAVGLTLMPIPLAGMTSPHWCWLFNLGTSSSDVRVRNGMAGADFLQLFPGEPALFPFLVSAQPWIYAGTVPTFVEYLILSA